MICCLFIFSPFVTKTKKKGPKSKNILEMNKIQGNDRNPRIAFLLAPQSGAHRIAPLRDFHTHPIHPTYSSEPRKTHDVIYFWKGNRTRTSKTMFPSV